MPSVSGKQHRFMEGIAHGMKPRSGKGPSKAVAREFVAADKASPKNYGNHLKRPSKPPGGGKYTPHGKGTAESMTRR